jgi:hypothetical protein
LGAAFYICGDYISLGLCIAQCLFLLVFQLGTWMKKFVLDRGHFTTLIIPTYFAQDNEALIPLRQL